jgi:probable HAF family extracellular repeat protein
LGGNQSQAIGVNDSGQVVGWSMLAGNSLYHAFLYQNGVMSDIGTFGAGNSSAANAVNNNGDVVGYVYNGSTGYQRAFLYSGGVMQDLNGLLPANSGWTLIEAHDINDNGQIVGMGLIDGVGHAFSMTPVPPGGCD